MRSLHAAMFVAAGLSLTAAPAAAQWELLPNGELAYRFGYSTTGTFTCRAVGYATGSCESSGNTVTIRDGDGGVATFSFTGSSGSLLASGTPQTVEMGTFTSTVSSTFTFPRLGGDTWSYFTFAGGLQVSPSSPRFGAWGAGYFAQGGSLLASQYNYGFSTVVGFRPPPNPLPVGWSDLVVLFNDIGMPALVPGGSPQVVTASVAFVPEPATVALLGGGLLALGGIGVLRRRQQA